MPATPEAVVTPTPIKLGSTIYVDCSTCGGSGKVSGIGSDGSPTQIDCPTCGGKGQIKWGSIVTE